MPWIELTTNLSYGGEQYPPGTLIEIGYVAGRALVLNNRAVWSDGPGEEDDSGDDPEPTDSQPKETAETAAGPPEAESADSEAAPETDVTPVSDVDWTTLKGIASAKQSEIQEALESAGVSTVQQALELDLKTLPGIGADREADARELLEAAANGSD